MLTQAGRPGGRQAERAAHDGGTGADFQRAQRCRLPALPRAARTTQNRNCPLSQNPGSEQPRQPCPDSMGKLVPPFHLSVAQALYVVGPLAAEFVEAPAIARALVVEGLGEFSWS